jgi:sigma-E factor negative regulatory protein RseA
MTDQIREQMSALLDGELRQDETGLLLRRMERDAGLRRAYGNYVLAGEILRSPGGLTASPGFAARVSAAIAQDAPATETVAAPGQPPARRWVRPAAGVAVAAGAALAAVLLVRPDGDDGAARFAQAPSGAPTTLALPVGGASPTPAQSQRLAGYLVAHGQYATPMGRRNIWSNALASDPGISRVTVEVPEQR